MTMHFRCLELFAHPGPRIVRGSTEIMLKAFAFWLCLLPIASLAAADDQAQWIWSGKAEDHSRVQLRKTFNVEGTPKAAFLAGTGDNHLTVWLNGKQVLKGDNWQGLESADVTKNIVAGENVLAIEGVNDGGAAGVLAVLKLMKADKSTVQIATDDSWKATHDASKGWHQIKYDDAAWSAPTLLGPIGKKSLPWSKSITSRVLETALIGNTEGSFVPRVAENVTPRKDFVVETVFEVPRSMGSWVSLAIDPQGRLIASDQGEAGLYVITPGHDGEPTQVQKLDVNVTGAHGLCWAFDSLYAMVNGGPEPGLHRMKDTDGDGLVDTQEHLIEIVGRGEHGPHAIVMSPDQKSLHIVAGNHTKLPDGITGSRIPQNWGEDLLLPRRWDANGHAAGILAPGGWILKIDPEGKTREVISIGYRNEYDIAFNADGELFAYDADMEWDLGSPWYRPTRVCHATSGSEFGWRSGTGKWPAYYEDSLPSAVDIGPGSPVGIIFGKGAKFPAKYQKALFILDWTYSTIYAIHLTPEGSTYRGEKEEFLTGQPMQVTDTVIGADGALYFAAGGRGTESTLYRARYVGDESTEPVDTKNAAGADQRKLRHRLEAFHGKTGADLDFLIKELDNDDRFIRYAARVALEAQPVDRWRDRFLHPKGLSGRATILGLMALSRQGKTVDLEGILETLGQIDFDKLDDQSQITLLRTYELALTRLGPPNDAWKKKLIQRFDPLYPAQSYPLNAELVQLLVYLQSPTVVTKTLALMDSLGPQPLPDWSYLISRSDRYGSTIEKLLADMPPARKIYLAFVLRNQKEGWTLPQRKKYFKFYIKASQHPGGNSYAKFLSQFREDALLTCTPAERIALEPITNVSLLAEPPKVNPPKGPGRKWTRDEVLATVDGQLKGRNFNRGRNLYFAVSCAKCHRLNGEGGAIGPDLSTAGKKFPMPDLVDSLLEPSKVISDQYASQQVITKDGQVFQGRAMPIGDELHIYTIDADAPPKILKNSEVEEVLPSKLSQMPVGLINSLNPEELKDLMAYIVSGANKKHAVYRRK